MNFRASETESSILSINLQYSKEKPKKEVLKAGGSGLIEYELIQSKKADINFMPVVCSLKGCHSKFRYYVLTSSS